MRSMGIKVGEYGELHTVPAMAWAVSFVVCGLGDAMLGQWVLLPLFVAAFYGGMIIIDLVTYPMLSFWRGWLRRRGLIAWYLVEVGGLWGTTTLVLLVLSPWWLRACANRRVSYVSKSSKKAVQSLREMSCAKGCPPIGAASNSLRLHPPHDGCPVNLLLCIAIRSGREPRRDPGASASLGRASYPAWGPLRPPYAGSGTEGT